MIKPGLLAAVQDLGRPGYGHLGVPHSGALRQLCDAVYVVTPASDRTGLRLDGPTLRFTLAAPGR